MDPFKPGDPITAASLNALAEAAERLSSLRTTGGIGLHNGPGGPVLSLQTPASFLAQLMTVSGSAYGWQEGFVNSNGAFVPIAGARSGTPALFPAYELNFAADLPVGVNGGTVVELNAAPNAAWYWFQHFRLGNTSNCGPCSLPLGAALTWTLATFSDVDGSPTGSQTGSLPFVSGTYVDATGFYHNTLSGYWDSGCVASTNPNTDPYIRIYLLCAREGSPYAGNTIIWEYFTSPADCAANHLDDGRLVFQRNPQSNVQFLTAPSCSPLLLKGTYQGGLGFPLETVTINQ